MSSTFKLFATERNTTTIISENLFIAHIFYTLFACLPFFPKKAPFFIPRFFFCFFFIFFYWHVSNWNNKKNYERVSFLLSSLTTGWRALEWYTGDREHSSTTHSINAILSFRDFTLHFIPISFFTLRHWTSLQRTAHDIGPKIVWTAAIAEQNEKRLHNPDLKKTWKYFPYI